MENIFRWAGSTDWGYWVGNRLLTHHFAAACWIGCSSFYCKGCFPQYRFVQVRSNLDGTLGFVSCLRLYILKACAGRAFCSVLQCYRPIELLCRHFRQLWILVLMGSMTSVLLGCPPHNSAHAASLLSFLGFYQLSGLWILSLLYCCWADT